MILSIMDVVNDELLTKICRKVEDNVPGPYLCLKIGDNFHEHIDFEKNNYNILEIRNRIFDSVNRALKMEPKSPRVTASILALAQVQIFIDSVKS